MRDTHPTPKARASTVNTTAGREPSYCHQTAQRRELVEDHAHRLGQQALVAFTNGGTMILSLGVALLLNRRMKGSDFFRAVYYAPSLLSVSVVTIAWGWLMDTHTNLTRE